MPLIALTGGIASGKSTIAARWAERGAVIVDADAIVRDVQEPGSPVLQEIVEAFGADVVADDGALRRSVLAGRVFADPDARRRLNAIVHPAVRAESQRRFTRALSADPSTVVVYDVPLLTEARTDDPWDLIVVAHAPADMRVDRLVAHRGFTPEDARARVEAQASDDERLAIADLVVDTAGTLDETIAGADAVWERIRAAS